VGSRKPESRFELENDPIEFAHSIALNALSSRAKSRRELETQLAKRGVDKVTAKIVLDRLSDAGLVDDREFAKAWSQSRQASKGISRRMLAQELNGKGIDRSISEEILAEISPEGEYEAALAIATKKARGVSHLTYEVQARRIFSQLARKGFSSSISSQIIKEVLSK
jgi:regulatory protein